LLDKFTGIRLSPDVRERIDYISRLSNKEQNFSDTLRSLIDRGLHSIEHEAYSINQDVEQNMQFIGRKHEVGDDLTLKEIAYILSYLLEVLNLNSFLSPKFTNVVNETFLAFIKSRSYSLNCPYIMSKLEEHSFFTDPSFPKALNQYSYEDIEKASLRAFKTIKEHKLTWKNLYKKPQIIGMAKILNYASNSTEEALTNPLKFSEALKPFLKDLIIIAKRRYANGITHELPVHYYNLELFKRQHSIQDMQSFEKHGFTILSGIGSGGEIGFAVSFHGEKQDNPENVLVWQSFTVYEMNDLMNISKFVNSMPAVDERHVSIEAENIKLNLGVNKTHDGVSAYVNNKKNLRLEFSSKSWERFIGCLIAYETAFSRQFEAIRYQYGSY